jgi:hypothetical protein
MGFDFRSSRTNSSEPRDDPDAIFRGGDPDPFGLLGRHCAACEGTVTIVLAVF